MINLKRLVEELIEISSRNAELGAQRLQDALQWVQPFGSVDFHKWKQLLDTVERWLQRSEAPEFKKHDLLKTLWYFYGDIYEEWLALGRPSTHEEWTKAKLKQSPRAWDSYIRSAFILARIPDEVPAAEYDKYVDELVALREETAELYHATLDREHKLAWICDFCGGVVEFLNVLQSTPLPGKALCDIEILLQDESSCDCADRYNLEQAILWGHKFPQES